MHKSLPGAFSCRKLAHHVNRHNSPADTHSSALGCRVDCRSFAHELHKGRAPVSRCGYRSDAGWRQAILPPGGSSLGQNLLKSCEVTSLINQEQCADGKTPASACKKFRVTV